jgi:hypothetical protein
MVSVRQIKARVLLGLVSVGPCVGIRNPRLLGWNRLMVSWENERQRIRAALEKGGIQFIDENGGGPRRAPSKAAKAEAVRVRQGRGS